MGDLLRKYIEEKNRLMESENIVSEIAEIRNDKLLSMVFDMFYSLRPLRRKRVEVCEHPEYGVIVVGKWIRVKNTWHTYGYLVHDPDELYRVIVSCGDKIADHVSKAKSEIFRELVSLARKIKLYDVTVERKINAPIPSKQTLYDGKIKYYMCDRIRVYSSSPSYLYADICDGRECYTDMFCVDNATTVIVFEDIIDDVNELYRELKEKIYRLKAENDKVISKMKELVAAYSIVWGRKR